jgi:DNA replication and repair protein RecF
MFLQKIALQNFRNYQMSVFELKSGANLLVGPNAIGKTSVIEAIHLLSTGDSFRANKIGEMVKFDQELARVKAKVGDNKTDDETLEILLNHGVVSGRRTQKRHFNLNGAKKRKKDFVGQFYSVVFRPEDMRLIEGSKSRRRKFMDESLSILDWRYARSLKMYEEALLKRSKLLWQIKEGLVPKTTLKYWNLTVVKHGTYLQEKRQAFLDSFAKISFPLDFTVEYQPSIISDERIEEYQPKAIIVGRSLIGPHKDDFIVKLDNGGEKNGTSFDVAVYGSRGQQRMAVLWLKTCQLEYLEEKSEQKVLLLLDDILSELDEEMREKVLSLLEGRQSIITSADSGTASEIKKYIKKINTIKLNAKNK